MIPSSRVTVTMRTHNRAAYLREAVESVMAQTFSNWNLLISDDASSDETPLLCQELMRADARIQVVRHQPGLGAADNWRFCLAQSQTHYFACLDDDNRYLPTFLESAVAALEGCSKAAFAFSDRWIIDADGNRNNRVTVNNSSQTGRSSLAAGLCADTPLAAISQAPEINSTLFVRDNLISAGGFRHIGGDLADFDIFLNLASQGYQGCYIPGRLIEYRSHPGNDAHTYKTSVPKVRSAIAILEAAQYQGQAECLRRSKLAQAYLNLSRALLLQGDLLQARVAVRAATQITPRNPRVQLVLAFLRLPVPIIRYCMRRRYDIDIAANKHQKMEEKPA